MTTDIDAVARLRAEITTLRNLSLALPERIAELERRWPVSKRGSNGQRAIGDLKGFSEALGLTARDAASEFERLNAALIASQEPRHD